MLHKSAIKSAAEDPVGRDGHHKEAAQVAKANREPKATPFSPAETWYRLELCAFCAQHFVDMDRGKRDGVYLA